MSELEAQAFEDYCVAHAEFAKEVEFEQRLTAGLAQLARGSTEDFVRVREPVQWQIAAAAAGILISLLAVFHLWRRPDPSAPWPVLAAATADAAPARSLRLAPLRGDADRPALPAGRMRVEIAGLFDTEAHYSVGLDRIEPDRRIATLATVHGLRPSSAVTLEVLIDGDQMPRGSYLLRVRQQTSADGPLDFELLRP